MKNCPGRGAYPYHASSISGTTIPAATSPVAASVRRYSEGSRYASAFFRVNKTVKW